MEAFFTSLATNGLAINLKKCVFAAPSLEILGHKISATGAALTANHAAEIKNCPPPEDIKQLQPFLGMVNFYHRFLPNCAEILKPLTDLLKGGAKMLEWTASAQEACLALCLDCCMEILVSSIPLVYDGNRFLRFLY
jgi:hypothetical protein